MSKRTLIILVVLAVILFSLMILSLVKANKTSKRQDELEDKYRRDLLEGILKDIKEHYPQTQSFNEDEKPPIQQAPISGDQPG